MLSEWKEGSYQHPLEDCLREAIERWRSDRAASWANELGNDEIIENCQDLEIYVEPFDKHEIFRRIEDFGRCILESRPGMLGRGPMTRLGADGDLYYNCQYFLQCVKENLQLSLADVLTARIEEAACRLAELADWEMFAFEGLPNAPNTRGYLSLIVDCYVWGFYAPCIAICRSAIEDALRRRIDPETCEKHLGERRGHQQAFSLADYIEVAKREEILNPSFAKEAHKVRERANKLLHSDPRLTEHTAVIVFETARILYLIETGFAAFHDL